MRARENFVQNHSQRVRPRDITRLDRAVFGLAAARPEFSAQVVITRPQAGALVLVGCGLLVCFCAWPHRTVEAVVWLMSLGFVVSILARGALVLLGRQDRSAPEVANDFEWPVYSILVPLYREAGILPQLTAALQAMDYPSDKLDVHLVLEESDIETRAAAERYSYSVVIVPEALPRTKPKACNYAVHSAKGEFLVVYDAEDRPEPDQLKKSVLAFRAFPEVSCFQAHLAIDRTNCWLQRMFALDYGMWFNALLPGLARLGAPLPLGGTSNHFRLSALLGAGLWDPFNVTEDADLGVRLARLGHKVRLLDSVTFEEAPTAFAVWLRQRTRWMKGYMQTLLVHWRRPSALIGDIGLGGSAMMQLFLGGAIWSAVVNPLLWLLCVVTALIGSPGTDGLGHFAEISGMMLLVVNVLLAALGTLRAGEERPSFSAVFGYPLYWLLISLATYRALYQLIRAPFHWEKTPHGVAP